MIRVVVALAKPPVSKIMPESPALPPPGKPHWLLRRADQAAVAVLVAAGLIATVGWWVYHGGMRGRLVEVDRAEPQSADFQVDINTAERPELMQLPGVGRALADRIIQSRRQHGPFTDPEDLRRVPGIGPKTLAALRGHLRPLPGRTTTSGGTVSPGQ
ncbi:MAG: helix-hairpin-helix domain-containing protein [Thermoguttaceae bacterium]|jgi:competence ComEA-like helix-hairpin-helix protein